MTFSFAPITSETILADIATFDDAKAVARDMRETAMIVADAHGEASEIARAVSARYFDFVDAMAEKFAA
jgi:hypothetical protein